MSMRERGGNEGGDKRKSLNIDGDSKKKIKSWKSLMEMKEYLRSEFEKKNSEWDGYELGGETHLHFAAYLGDVDATKMLIEDNAEVNAVSWEYQLTALHFACYGGHVDVATVLLQNGADVNAVDEQFQLTALHVVAEKGHLDVARVLIRNSANVNAVDEDKWTALHHAAESGHVDIV